MVDRENRNDGYKKAGVNIEAGYEAVEKMKKHVQRTMRSEVLGGLGGFGGMFELPVHRYRQPVLVSGTDGVGTKLKLAFMLDQHDTIGIDAVAMCVNDIVVQGAEPLYFLDYLACGQLIPEKAEAIVKGIADGCQQAGCALIGGETAEMPGFYADGEYDIAGFSVGVVEKDEIVDGTAIQTGDVLIGLPSSGLHSNGFSLIRDIVFEQAGLNVHDPFPGQDGETIGQVLLTPTRIYVSSILSLLKEVNVHGMSHITGGGLLENIPRMLPQGCRADIDVHSWNKPDLFPFLQEKGNLLDSDMYHTFNMGIGFVIAVDRKDAEQSIHVLQRSGESPVVIGEVVDGERSVHLGGLPS